MQKTQNASDCDLSSHAKQVPCQFSCSILTIASSTCWGQARVMRFCFGQREGGGGGGGGGGGPTNQFQPTVPDPIVFRP